VLKKYFHFSCGGVSVNQHFLISVRLLKFLCSEHPAVGKSQVCLQSSGGGRAIQRPLDCDGKWRTRLQVSTGEDFAASKKSFEVGAAQKIVEMSRARV